MRTDGRNGTQTEMMKLTVAYGNFANTPKKGKSVFRYCHTTPCQAAQDVQRRQPQFHRPMPL